MSVVPAPAAPRTMFQRCPCGHLWMHHDIEEYDGDGSDLCCIEGCDQSACPGRNPTDSEATVDGE